MLVLFTQVITLVHKIAEFADLDSSSGEATKGRDDFLASIYEISLPRAPWDGGICKVCGMDRDDDNVLLCDKCDSEYHRYCLSPPLTKIPEGNWYCPSCVGKTISGSAAHSSAVNQCGKRKIWGEFMHKFLESMTRLVNLLETKEYWEFTVDEVCLITSFASLLSLSFLITIFVELKIRTTTRMGIFINARKSTSLGGGD